MNFFLIHWTFSNLINFFFKFDTLFCQICWTFSKSEELFLSSMNFFQEWWIFLSILWNFFKLAELFFKIDELFSKMMNFFSKPINLFKKRWTFFKIDELFFEKDELLEKFTVLLHLRERHGFASARGTVVLSRESRACLFRKGKKRVFCFFSFARGMVLLPRETRLWFR